MALPCGLDRNAGLARDSHLTHPAPVVRKTAGLLNMDSGGDQVLPASFFLVAIGADGARRAAVYALPAGFAVEIKAVCAMVCAEPGGGFNG